MRERRFTIAETPIDGLMHVTRSIIGDHRGFLSRLYCSDELAKAGFDAPIMQVNQTLTRMKGAIRGMHFQFPPHAEDKFVSCIRGAVLDVAVDLRSGSSTFLQWHSEPLSAENGASLFIPKGFAHGFQTLVEDCELLYFHTASYSKEAEGALNPLDPDLGIAWPLRVTDMSTRDRGHPLLADTQFTGIPL